MRISGFWVSDIQYRMYDPRTHTTKMVFVPGANDPTLYDVDELNDIVEDVRTRVQAEIDEKANYQAFSKDEQHDFGDLLHEINASKKHRRETGNERYF
jgi:hypothetical protein